MWGRSPGGPHVRTDSKTDAEAASSALGAGTRQLAGAGTFRRECEPGRGPHRGATHLPGGSVPGAVQTRVPDTVFVRFIAFSVSKGTWEKCPWQSPEVRFFWKMPRMEKLIALKSDVQLQQKFKHCWLNLGECLSEDARVTA